MPDIEFIIASFAIGVLLFELINYFKFVSVAFAWLTVEKFKGDEE